MSAALLAAYARTHVVTVGSSGTGIYGFSASDGIGALSPNTVFGQEVRQLLSTSSLGAADLRVFISGSHALGGQSFFRTILVQDSDGVQRSYNTADASYAEIGGFGQWTWGSSSDMAWDAAPATRHVQFLR